LGNLPLASPETKEHSRDAANRWLADQLKMSQDQPTRLGSVIDQLEKRKACAAAQGLQTQAFDSAVAMVRDMETDDIHPTIAQSFIEPMSQVWADRLSRTKPVPTDRTVGHWIDQFLALRNTDSACFVLAALAIPDRMEELPNSASYLKHYLDLLRDDRRKIVKAASLAQKAADYILSGGVVPQAKKRRRASPAQQ